MVQIFGVLLLLVAVSIALIQRMRLKRAPEKEGEQDTGAVRAYNQTCSWLPFKVLRFFIMRELKNLRPQGKLVDIGCGSGQLAILISQKYPGLEVKGLDVNLDMIETAVKNRERASAGNITFVLGDVQNLPFENEYFDVVVSSLSLHHWENAGKAFDEIQRVLKPGGSLLLVDVRRDCYWWFFCGLALMQIFFTPEDIRRTNGAIGSVYAGYTPDEITGLLKAVPFRNVKVKSNPGWMTARAQK